jgi:hypothetical protein
VDIFKVEPDSGSDTAHLSSCDEDPLIDVKQEEYDIAVMENVTKVSVFEISGSRGDECEDVCVLGCCTM